MSDPEVVALPNGQFVENCYLLADPASREAVIIDPGEEPAMFLAELDTRGWTLRDIWLTHAHIDHVMGVNPIHRASGAPIHLHPADRGLYDAVVKQGEWYGIRLDPLPEPQEDLAHGGSIAVGEFAFDIRHTPGHSPGSVSFVGHGLVFGGDVLFNGSIGRTDLPGSDLTTLMQTIQHQFLSLPDSTRVLAGHGPETTIGVERLTNPFLTGAYELD
ncbi:MAG: MBL fold metallo-hydrolase [Gemmatimonadota bacterium]